MLTSNNTTTCKGTWKESQIDWIVCRICTVWLQQDQEEKTKTNNNQIRLKQKKSKLKAKIRKQKVFVAKKKVILTTNNRPTSKEFGNRAK